MLIVHQRPLDVSKKVNVKKRDKSNHYEHMVRVLYLLPSANFFGGTAKKTLELIQHSTSTSVVYFWSESYKENHSLFREAGAMVYAGSHNRSFIRSVRKVLEVIDGNAINVIQTQFYFGEILGCVLKLLRPRLKLIVAFVSSDSCNGIKRLPLLLAYRMVDCFVYISQYVRKEKMCQFNQLRSSPGRVIYNGACIPSRTSNGSQNGRRFGILAVSGLTKLKNIAVLINAMYLLVEEFGAEEFQLMVLGDGPERLNLEAMIRSLGIERNVSLVGYQSNVGDYLENCSVFVHPATAEGFGIAVTEAMLAGRPVIAADAGALRELIVNNESGLLVDPQCAREWASSVVRLWRDRDLASQLAMNGKQRAFALFSVDQFASSYDRLHTAVLLGGPVSNQQ